jgi:hypothetical protein
MIAEIGTKKGLISQLSEQVTKTLQHLTKRQHAK